LKGRKRGRRKKEEGKGEERRGKKERKGEREDMELLSIYLSSAFNIH
jgi:hypothetical protein